jgi:formamidopyrimidine-DNA glycosylase
MSGVGNWVADEVLYQARVDPAKRCSALRDEEVCVRVCVCVYVCVYLFSLI